MKNRIVYIGIALTVLLIILEMLPNGIVLRTGGLEDPGAAYYSYIDLEFILNAYYFPLSVTILTFAGLILEIYCCRTKKGRFYVGLTTIFVYALFFSLFVSLFDYMWKRTFIPLLITILLAVKAGLSGWLVKDWKKSIFNI